MKKETVLLVGVALIVGVLVGILVTRGGRDSSGPTPSPGQAAPMVNLQQIQLLEGIVANDPANRTAWVQLGNAYFDSDQPLKSIEAYGKALEIDPNDPNVLTDQGVMYRRLGWFDKAVVNFTRANEIDPAHAQSLFNLGIVYFNDLQDMAAAKKAWNRYLEVQPNGPGADQVRKWLQMIDSHPPLSAPPPASKQ